MARVAAHTASALNRSGPASHGAFSLPIIAVRDTLISNTTKELMMAKAPAAKPTRTCFVIGPIGEPDSSTRKHADWVLDGLVKHVLEHDPFIYSVLRAEADDRPGQISAQVIERIFDADLVVADLTDLNANVMYELAIRHTLSKHVILICDVGTKLPFDLQDARTIFFEIPDYLSVEEARGRIAKQAKEIEDPEFVPANPVTAARGLAELSGSADSKDQLVAKLVDVVSGMNRRISELEHKSVSPLQYFGSLPPATTSGLLSLTPGATFSHLLSPIPSTGPVTNTTPGTTLLTGEAVEGATAVPITGEVVEAEAAVPTPRGTKGPKSG